MYVVILNAMVNNVCVYSCGILTMADLGELILPLYERESVCDK